MPHYIHELGATPIGSEGCSFRVWAPRARQVAVHVVRPVDRLVSLELQAGGYHCGVIEGVSAGADYFFRLDEQRERPDPASRLQPEGVHGSSRVVSSEFDWGDAGWSGLVLGEYVIYELHVGTFTPAGTLDGVVEHLVELKEFGVTAIELMPIAQFPGSRNWGYDGVFPFAVQNTYGGPEGLKRLVNAAHREGLAVILDVVYNHLGPEGNYLGDFGPYLTDRYRTPWGSAMNFDGPESDEVRRYFLENALYWLRDCHIDALRLDAVHAIYDFSAVPFLEELAEVCHGVGKEMSREVYLIAESDLNMARHILPRERGGYGLDAQWSDDFHHCLHVLLTGERSGYYEDYGGVEQLAKVWREGYAYTGEPSRHRRRRHGSDPAGNGVKQFVVCGQNHDQIGNRFRGDRWAATLPMEKLKLGAGAVLLSPFIPMLFMGEEYGETAPFEYFVNHTDLELIEAVRRGRREEFASFAWREEVPDPQDAAVFERCQLRHELGCTGSHRVLREFYRACLDLRRELPPIGKVEKSGIRTLECAAKEVLTVHQWTEREEVLLIFNFSGGEAGLVLAGLEGRWRKRLDSAEACWLGPGSTALSEIERGNGGRLAISAHACAVYQQVRTR